MTGKTDAYGVELPKKIDLEKQQLAEGGSEERKGLSQGVRQKGADT